ncbi:MAG TPA: hypothetical protein VD789_11390, partial [Thermomicrobiales bacterium]|nr:hypothetical protein [Thermomicrobiales bacterium]
RRSGSLAELREATDPVERRALAVGLVEQSHNLELVRAALAVLTREQDPELRPLLHRKYEWCEAIPTRRDSSGFIRAGIVRALHPIIHPDDDALLIRAMSTYQQQGMYELCAELRATGLRAMNDLDPDTAAMFAARFLADPLTSFSGEPALTAIRVLGVQQRLEAVFALASWGTADGQVVGEALRNLVEIRPELVELLIERHRDAEDSQVVVGLFDLLLNHRDRSRWYDLMLRFIGATDDLDVYGIIVTSIVASRDDHLIQSLRSLATDERDQGRRVLLEHALELA